LLIQNAVLMVMTMW